MRICKSPFMGGRAIVCKSCDHHHYVYYSCGHSHCPICQAIKREQWIDKLKNELLKVPYVHMVFTLPHQLNSLARRNKQAIYNLIMRASWSTVKTLSARQENLGALPGMITVLHTFGSDMKYHIHTHCLVTFGGITKNGAWIQPKRKEKIARYRQINSTYKNIFITQLQKLYAQSKIDYHLGFAELIAEVQSLKWVVHNTKPTIDTTVLENYLARYINRVAISKNRISYIKATQQVGISYKDYRKQEKGKAAPKAVKLVDPLSFIHQFMEHVLPPYFQKSRRYGLHASRTKKKYQSILPTAIKRNGEMIRTLFQIIKQLIKEKPYQCAKCQSEDYEIIQIKPDKSYIDQIIIVPSKRAPPQAITINQITR